ncbi:MAG: hypothetical protein H7Y33_13425 [Cytophagales bacterium]|nr:hypothetical protein [Rhizobacter sp.]
MSFVHSRTPSTSRLLLLAAGLLLATTSLHAAPPKAREGTLGGGKAGGPILSMAQLRACMAQDTRIQTQNEEAARLKQQMTNDREEIDRGAAALKADLASIDRSNKEAVEALVARAQAHDKSIESYQARVEPFNAHVQAVDAERAAYAKACQGRRYLEDDYKDIKAGK